MPLPPPLHEWYVISLRPLGDHARLRRLAGNLGAKTFALSTQKRELLRTGAALDSALACSKVLFTSPAAVAFAGKQTQLQRLPDQTWLAVGSGTAAALTRHGIAGVITPTLQTSEGLLALPELRTIAGTTIGLITAPGGRGVLAEQLTRSGAQVLSAEVYRRVPLTLAPHRLQALTDLPEPSVLLVSSGEALTALWQELSPTQQTRLKQRLAIASSERLAKQMHALGFERIHLAANASPPALLETLRQLGVGGSLPVG